MSDDLDLDLKSAFRAVKDTYDGGSPDADLTLQRALFASRRSVKRRKVTQYVLIPIAAALFASTAWAGATGRLAPVVDSVREVFRAETAPSEAAPAAKRVAVTAPLAAPSEPATNEAPEAPSEPANLPTDPPAVVPNEAPSDPSDTNAKSAGPIRPSAREPAPIAANGAGAREPAPIAANGAGARSANLGAAASPQGSAEAARAPRAATAAPSQGAGQDAPSAGASSGGSTSAVGGKPDSASTDVPSPAAAAPSARPDGREAALFAEANRIHFTDRDPARALAAWDRYLAAAPNGALAPEARYNRALALIRLNRTAEARAELETFAAGSYRRAEARALLDALARDAGP